MFYTNKTNNNYFSGTGGLYFFLLQISSIKIMLMEGIRASALTTIERIEAGI